jgi:hypothetical protein
MGRGGSSKKDEPTRIMDIPPWAYLLFAAACAAAIPFAEFAEIKACIGIFGFISLLIWWAMDGP